MQTITIAVVGLGYWGPNLLRNFTAAEGCHVAYGCDLLQANLDKLSRSYPHTTFTTSFDQVLADPSVQLVAVATPTSGHYPLAKAALEAGKHVLIEKPMTSTAAQADELIAIAKRSNLHIFVDHTFVYSPAVRKIADIVQSGDLGELLYVDTTRINLGLIQKDTNVLWDLAIHDLSIIGTFTNLADVNRIYAHGRRHISNQVEIGHLHLSFKNGVESHIHVSWLSPVKLRQTIIVGSKKMIVYDDMNLSEKVKVYDKGVSFDRLVQQNNANPFYPVYRSGDVYIPALPNKEELAIEVRHILQCLRKEETPILLPETAANMVRILEQANRSLETAQPVSTVA